MHPQLEPDPAAAPVVQRIFRLYVDGMSYSAIAAQLTREGIPCPSAHDATRNPHRNKTAWQQGAVRAILLNPRYTGHEVWNKQRKEERLLDVDDVTLSHRTHVTHNPPDEWIHSIEPAHEAISSPALFDAARIVRTQRARNQGRQERAGKLGAPLRSAWSDPVQAVRAEDATGHHPQPRLLPLRVQRGRSRPLPRSHPPAHLWVPTILSPTLSCDLRVTMSSRRKRS
ncbi:recombinase family protein [Streptomyces sp. NPDC003996]